MATKLYFVSAAWPTSNCRNEALSEGTEIEIVDPQPLKTLAPKCLTFSEESLKNQHQMYEKEQAWALLTVVAIARCSMIQQVSFIPKKPEVCQIVYIKRSRALDPLTQKKGPSSRKRLRFEDEEELAEAARPTKSRRIEEDALTATNIRTSATVSQPDENDDISQSVYFPIHWPVNLYFILGVKNVDRFFHLAQMTVNETLKEIGVKDPGPLERVLIYFQQEENTSGIALTLQENSESVRTYLWMK